MKKIIAILTAASITAAMAIPVSAAEPIYKVNCSSNSTDGSEVWAGLDSDGVLNVIGTGKMDSFGFLDDIKADYPWKNTEDAELIKKIVVQEGITHFDMVWQTQSVKEIHLPNSIITIDLFEFLSLFDTNAKVFLSPQSFENNPDSDDMEPPTAEMVEKIEQMKEKAADSKCTYYIYKDTSQENFVTYYDAKAKYMGDVNSDGNIDLADASSMLENYARAAAGLDVSADESFDTDTADLDKDGIIGLNDAASALSYYAQKAVGIKTDWTEILK